MNFALQPAAAQNAHRACYCLVAVFQSLDQLWLQSNKVRKDSSIVRFCIVVTFMTAVLLYLHWF